MKRMVTTNYIYVQILLFITEGTQIEKLNSLTLLCLDLVVISISVASLRGLFIQSLFAAFCVYSAHKIFDSLDLT